MEELRLNLPEDPEPETPIPPAPPDPKPEPPPPKKRKADPMGTAQETCKMTGTVLDQWQNLTPDQIRDKLTALGNAAFPAYVFPLEELETRTAALYAVINHYS